MCIGGLDTVKYFEQFNDGSEEFEKAMNRLKYEVAKGIGKRIKHMPPPKPGFHDTTTCGECGYTAYTFSELLPELRNALSQE